MPDDPDPSRYVRGETYARRERPRFEFKPTATGYTGGGYPRVRSTERREHTPGDGTDDVFVSIHRLAAVAWHLPDGTLGEDVRLSALDGVDVHHTTPDGGPGMPSANGEAWTTVVDHGRHSEITQSQMRAWGEDSKQQATDDDVAVDRCPECGDESDGAAVGGREGLCLGCAKQIGKQSGETIQL